MKTHFCSALRHIFHAGFLVVILGACGGGSGDNSAAPTNTSAPGFLPISGNKNGAVVTTGNGTVQFLENHHLFSQGQEISNVLLSTDDGTVSVDGNLFGKIVLISGTDGLKDAVFLCTNNNYVMISGTTLSCGTSAPVVGSNTGNTGTPTGSNPGNTGGAPPGTPNPTPSQETATPLSGCVDALRNPQTSYVTIRNNCGQAIHVAWGFVDGTRGLGSWTIPASGVTQTGDTYEEFVAHGGYKFFICPSAYNASNPTTHQYVSIQDPTYICIRP